ncbi:MAG: ABC transporter permease [Eggerthellaceae bacterium]|jgi:ABC-2 type transport system permease protein|nr:ABC transporter permease [Eggerthellaceae bacterium]MCH4220377.1 ABC transporter permease [Eggerthellaceae bacterium]
MNSKTESKELKRQERTRYLQHNRFILTSLVSKDFKLKYRRSVLGVLWSLLNPLLMMIVLSAVFSYMFRFSIEHFALYLIIGQTLFTMMQNSTTGAMTSIITSAPLIKKVKIEKTIFPLEQVIFELVNFAISMIAIAMVMVYYQVCPDANILLLPILLFDTVVFCAGLGFLLSAMAVFFRDIVHLWGVVCMAWSYATPLFYPMEMLPDWMQNAMVFNPMYHYVTYFRDILMYNVNPGGMENLVCLGMALITFAIGLLVFRATEKKFIFYV